MGALDGTIKTPMGDVSKKTALLVGGGLGIVAVIWYRGRKAKAATASAGANTGINPATGYPYGSPEDAAALAAQSAYVTPATGGGGSNIPTTGVGYTNNGQWTQAATTYLLDHQLVVDATALSQALGRYVTGQPCNDTDRTLIQQAIAVMGYPPVAGPTGYPPSINTSHPVTPPVTPPADTPPAGTPPPAGGHKLPPPSGFHDEGPIWTNSLVYRWNAVPGAVSYVLSDGGQEWHTDGPITGWQRDGLVHNGSYFTKIASVNSTGERGGWSQTLVSHTKN